MEQKYSEEDLKHLIHVFQKDANEARAKAEEYQRKFELCREECKKWKTKYLKAKELLEIFTLEEDEEEWIGGELGTCSKCGHEGCSSDIWDGIDENDYHCPKCGRRVIIRRKANGMENR